MTSAKAPEPKVIIVGAGPVGLFTALKLAQSGIPVEVMEQAADLSISPRAAGYFAGALMALEKAGLLSKLEAAGFTGSGISWRRPLQDGEDGQKKFGDVIANLPFYNHRGSGSKKHAAIYLPQHELARILYGEALATGLVTVSFNHQLVSIDENDDRVRATFRTQNGHDATRCSEFLIGADGGKSTTRKLLNIPFKGFSWPDRVVAIDFHYNIPNVDPDFPTSLIIDPVHYGLITPLKPYDSVNKTLYRVSIAVSQDDPRSDEELASRESILDLLDKIVPGPRPLQVEKERASAYRIHQVCASTFRRGRCLLAGDAAHLNNPFGAMGLTTGLLDGEALADSLDLIINEGHALDLLTLYSNERSRVFQLFVSPLTSQNKLRMGSDPDFALDDWMLHSLKERSPGFLENYGKPFVETWRTDIRDLVAKGHGSGSSGKSVS